MPTDTTITRYVEAPQPDPRIEQSRLLPHPHGNWMRVADHEHALTAAHAARDAAERELKAYRAQMMAAGHVPYLDRMRELAEQRDAALRERDEARAFIAKLLEHGSWYISAIELDTRHVDGELLKDEAERIAGTR